MSKHFHPRLSLPLPLAVNSLTPSSLLNTPPPIASFHDELQSIRSNKSSRYTLLSGILDIKLRQIGQLNSKPQILSACQNWMTDKVLYYMNLLDEAEIKYYLQVEDLTNKLTVKETAIQQQIKMIGEFEEEKKVLEECLEVERQQRKVIERGREREERYREEDRKKYVSVSRLQSSNEELQRQLNDITRQHLDLRTKHSISEQQNLSRESQITLLQNQVLRLRARLQDHHTDDTSSTIKYINQYKISYTMSISIKPPEVKMKKPVGEKYIRQVMLEGMIVRGKAPRAEEEGGEVGMIFEGQGPRVSDEGTQTSGAYLWVSKMKDITLGDPMSVRTHTRRPLSKDLAIKEEHMEKLKSVLFRQILSLKKDLKTLIEDTNTITSKRLAHLNLQRQELLDILQNHPSRQQDIEYIHQLQQQNKELMVLVQESDSKAETAYKAMNEFKLELERYRKNTTIMVKSPNKVKSKRERGAEFETINPYKTTSQSHRISWSLGKKRSGGGGGTRSGSRGKSTDEDVLISTIIRDSLGSVDLSMRNGRKLNSSLSVYRDEYQRSGLRSVL